jgi:hypothetical protein
MDTIRPSNFLNAGLGGYKVRTTMDVILRELKHKFEQ